MAQKKQSTKQKRLKKALPVLGIAGVSFSLVGGASASASAPTADIPSQNTSPRQEIFLGEEELSDVSLATFYVFDKEGIAKPQAGQQLAWWRCGDAAAAADAADALGAAAAAAAVAAVAAGQLDVAAPAKAASRSDHVERYKLLWPGPA